MRAEATTLALLLPAGRIKNRILQQLGHIVHPEARIGPNLALGVERLEIGRATIGTGNLLRGLRLLRLGDGAVIANFNWITVAEPFAALGGRTCRLELGRDAAVTSHHLLDCSGGIFVGDFSTISGAHSDLMTHGIDDLDNVQDCAPIRIGRHARLGSCNRVVMGSVLPDRSITAMGAVVVPGLTETDRLYAGVPAVAKKTVSGRWFSRDTGLTPVRTRSALSAADHGGFP